MLHYFIVPRQCGLTTFLKRTSSDIPEIPYDRKKIDKCLHLTSMKSPFMVNLNDPNKDVKFCKLMNALNYRITSVHQDKTMVSDTKLTSYLDPHDYLELKQFIISGKPIVVEGIIGGQPQYRAMTISVILAIQKLRKELLVGKNTKPIPVYWFDSILLDNTGGYHPTDTILKNKNTVAVLKDTQFLNEIKLSVNPEIGKELTLSDIKIRDIYGDTDKLFSYNAIMNVFDIIKLHPLTWISRDHQYSIDLTEDLKHHYLNYYTSSDIEYKTATQKILSYLLN